MNHRARYVVPLPRGRSLALGERTLVMGILNVPPDSFADGGLRLDSAGAVAGGRRGSAGGARLPGGELAVTWYEEGEVHMTGPAAEVFSGIFPIPEDDAGE